MKLVIVESPAKAATIGKFLGADYKVLASYGHVRDLPKSASEIPVALKKESWSRLGVNVEGDFSAIYVVQKESRHQIAELKKYCKDADEVILATDEDREGESISWHLLEVLKPKVPVKRIAFHEITRTAIEEAMRSPRSVNDQLVRAQETRRILDRLFGYELSPVLWRKVRSKLSAGRVQSVALRLVVEREEDRRAFCKAAYWDAEAELAGDGKTFKATLVSVDGRRVAGGKDFDSATGGLKESNGDGPVWLDENRVKTLVDELHRGLPWKVAAVEEKETTQRPYPPFITSTLQQAASSLLGFSPRKTMQLAQKLYEGVDMGEGGREGLITYMRTDSVVLSEKALQDAGAYIRRVYGEAYHARRQYTTKSKMAQEAHEAIRPTHIHLTPDDVAAFLNKDEIRLYRIIWNRAVASQMADAKIMRTAVDIEAKGATQTGLLRAAGALVVFPGFLRVMNDRQKEGELPRITPGMAIAANTGADIQLNRFEPVPHETQAPARYTEASLVRRLEEEGIGRPSTYAPTVAVIQQRGYVERIGTALAPTYLGIAVTFLLREHFSEYVDLGFTANMEDILDAIAEGQQDWLSFLRGFYYGGKEKNEEGLKPRVDQSLETIDFPVIPVGKDASGRSIVVRLGKTVPFLQRGSGENGEVASIPEKLYYDELTVTKAEEMFNNRAAQKEGLGICPQTGKKVFLLEGPYGPYVQLGGEEEEKKPKRIGLPRGMKPEDVSLEKALQLLSLPRILGKHPETNNSVAVSVGRFGPYVVHDGDFRSLDGALMFKITLEEALAMLAQPKPKRGAKKLLRTLREKTEDAPAIELYEGRYGPYVTDGSTNASLPKTVSVEQVELDQALQLIQDASQREKTKRPSTRKAGAKRKTAPRGRKSAGTRDKEA
ncbi:MAG TPA: type I DNA topoisomerase [Candidatus Hydrogenedentes bacterium]|nr:type I DNA topoisomerase [Candidatus Hydrogenedentota bacterium]